MRCLPIGLVLLGGCWSKYDDCGNTCACLNTCSSSSTSTSAVACAKLALSECEQRTDCLVIEGRELSWVDTASDCYERGAAEEIGCIDADTDCLPDTRLSQAPDGTCYEIEGCAPVDFVPCITQSTVCP